MPSPTTGTLFMLPPLPHEGSMLEQGNADVSSASNASDSFKFNHLPPRHSASLNQVPLLLLLIIIFYYEKCYQFA